MFYGRAAVKLLIDGAGKAVGGRTAKSLAPVAPFVSRSLQLGLTATLTVRQLPDRRPGRSIVGPPLLFAELVQALLCNGMHYRGATLSKTLSDEKSEQDLWPRARAAQRRGYNTTFDFDLAADD